MIKAIEADVHGAWAGLGRSTVCELNETPDAAWMLSGMPDQDYNKVFRSEFQPDDADARIEEILAYYESKSVPMSWWLMPSSGPADLGARLEARGLNRRSDLPGMALHINQVNGDFAPPTGFVIERVQDDDTLAAFVHISSVAFSLPETMEPGLLRIASGAGYGQKDRFCHFLGRLDGEPVATATGYFGEGVVGVQNITTVPQARRRGVGTATTMAVIREARERGYRIASLQSSEAAYSMYERMGFREYVAIIGYVRDFHVDAPAPLAPVWEKRQKRMA